MAATEQIEKQSQTHEEKVAAQEIIDFKMVTFSLGGKDYGIDIMRVKEIAKFSQFTYVPNTAPYVRGVYNLRGDIISIIDLRVMFNVSAEPKAEGKAENGLILRLENNLLGAVVDSIDRVVGFSSTQIQPPHPIFGDINIKFISGVAEHEGRLYIILDVDRIFSRDDESERTGKEAAPTPAPREERPEEPVDSPRDRRENRTFLVEGLATFSGFHITPVNEEWFERRVTEWEDTRSKQQQDVQLTGQDAAEEFLAPFFSDYNRKFWGDEYVARIANLLPDATSSLVHVWNPGCGNGHESFSILMMLKHRYPENRVKVWAGDTDLLKISTAPNLVFRLEEIPEYAHQYVEESKNGYTFVQSVKDQVLFEFSDLRNGASMTKMDLIVCRDVVSFFSHDVQVEIFSIFEEILKPTGTLVLGDNERAPDETVWLQIDSNASVFRFK